MRSQSLLTDHCMNKSISAHSMCTSMPYVMSSPCHFHWFAFMPVHRVFTSSSSQFQSAIGDAFLYAELISLLTWLVDKKKISTKDTERPERHEVLCAVPVLVAVLADFLAWASNPTLWLFQAGGKQILCKQVCFLTLRHPFWYGSWMDRKEHTLGDVRLVKPPQCSISRLLTSRC